MQGALQGLSLGQKGCSSIALQFTRHVNGCYKAIEERCLLSDRCTQALLSLQYAAAINAHHDDKALSGSSHVRVL